MKHPRNTFHLALLTALLLFAGMPTLRAAAAQQSGDQTDSSSTKKPSESKQTPSPAPAAPTGAAATTAPATAAKPAASSAPAVKPALVASTPAASKPGATQQARPANSSGMVWVNTDSGIYHKPGTRYYGKTKQGKYMSEADAIKAGYRAAGKK
jgi:hypothetical protein